MMSSLLQAGGLTPGYSFENISNLFESLDLNGDGHISEDEFIKAFLDYEHSVYFRIFNFLFSLLTFWIQPQNTDKKQDKLSVKKLKERRKIKGKAFHNLSLDIHYWSWRLKGWE